MRSVLLATPNLWMGWALVSAVIGIADGPHDGLAPRHPNAPLSFACSHRHRRRTKGALRPDTRFFQDVGPSITVAVRRVAWRTPAVNRTSIPSPKTTLARSQTLYALPRRRECLSSVVSQSPTQR